MSSHLDVSVIVPTYNRKDYIEKALLSIITQSHAPAEIIVVDDGSTDDTATVVRGFVNPVKYLRIENGGECRARNAGVAISGSPLVAFCDSDDIWEPNKLELQTELFEQDSSLEYSFTNFRTVVNDQPSATTKFDSLPADFWQLPRREFGPDLFVVEGNLFTRLLRNQPIFPSTLMMKRSFFEAVGKWNEPLGRTPSVDLEFHLRCVSQSRVGVVAKPVVGIRKHASNFSGDSLRTTIGEIAVLQYVLAHNPSAKAQESEIAKQIMSRRCIAAEEAFARENYDLMFEQLKSIPMNERAWKLQVKSVVAHLPKSLCRFVQNASPMRARN